MIKFNYYKLSKSKKIRYLKHDQKNNPYIVFLHGFMSDLEGKKPQQFLKFAIKKKYGFLALEYSGHGKSSGKFTAGNISKWSKETELLIKKTTDKRNLETTDKRNNTPLLKLIGTSIRISIKDRYRGMENSELYKAALKLVNLLIKKRVNINAADNNRNTPLHRVLKNNDFELAHILMEAGADTELTNKKGKTPLQSIKTEGSNEDYDGADGLTRFKEFIYKRVRASKKLTRTLRSHATANITKKVYKMSKGTLPSELGEEVAKYIIGSPRHTYSRLTGKKRKKRKKSKRR